MTPAEPAPVATTRGDDSERVRFLAAAGVATSAWGVFALAFTTGALPHALPPLTSVTALSHAAVMLGVQKRRPADVQPYVHVLAALSVVGLLAECFVGGQTSFFGIWFFAAVPGVVAHVGSVRATVGWAAASVGSVVVVHLVAQVHPMPVLLSRGEASQLAGQVGLAATMSALSLMARRASTRREHDLLAQQKLVEVQAAEVAKARDDAIAAARVKTSFLANMSHELRTPLNAVIGVASVLRETELSPEQREYVSTIDESSQALLLLISDVLDFSKLEAGKVEPERVPFDVVDLVEGASDMVAREADKRGLELVTVIEDTAPVRVVGDAARTKQILVNLLANAVKFTRKGEVVVRVSGEPLGTGRVMLRITVRDTGIGIPASKLDRLFRPFSQVDAGTTREFGGSGLGLAISHALAQVLGGRLTVDSDEGKGSTFSLAFPADTAPSRKPVPAASLEGLLAGTRVLVVDDHETTARTLGALVSRHGGVPTLALSCDEARSAARSARPFHYALLDHGLPDMPGATLAVELAREPGLAGTTVVLMARRGSAPDPLPSVITAKVSKPVKLERLAAALRARADDEWHAPSMRVDSVSPASLAPRDLSGETQMKETLHVLVAEDNLVVQRVTRTMLEKLGQTCDVAANGREAVQRIRERRYDVVLMDVQMPELDGIEATRLVTETVSRSVRPRIIGLSANALPGDRERCIAAGMDGFLAKPIQLGDLEHALFGKTTRKRSPKSSISDVVDTAVVEELRAADGGELLRELVAIFLDDSVKSVAAIRAALVQGDLATVAATAHRLKGAAGTVGAVAVFSSLAVAESRAVDGNAAGVEEVLDGIEGKLQRSLAALERMAAHA